MGLINLVANQSDFYYYQAKGYVGGLGNFSAKKLPYGNDRPDGGSSNQPYIVTPLPSVDSDEFPSSPDFLLRNGYLNAVDSAKDISRLTKYFADLKSPSGILFGTKQQLLGLQNPKVIGVNSNIENNIDVGNIYNPINTVLQAGVLSVGYHLNKQGLNPFELSYIDGGEYGYFNAAKTADKEDKGKLRLLYEVKKTPNTSDTNQNFAREAYGINTNQSDILLSYIGGANAPGGFGNTNIKIWNSLDNNYLTTLSLGAISTQSVNKETGTILINVVDFRKTINETKGLKPYGPNVQSYSDYTKFNREKGVGDGGYGTSQTYYKRPSNVNQTLNPNLSISSDNAELGVLGEDIIDFNFRLLNNNGNHNTTIDFRAYIEDFQDSYNATWDPFKYVGRADTFYKYSNINRTFNITFVVPALSRADMIGNYQKLNALTWATMPDYSTDGYMRGNAVKLIIGDYFKGVAAVINSLTFSPIMEMGFDINRYSAQDEFEDRSKEEGDIIKRTDSELFVGQLPKGIRVQAQMSIIHDFIPNRGETFIGWSEGGNNDRYIINEKGTPKQNVRIADKKGGENFVANKPDINNMRGKYG